MVGSRARYTWRPCPVTTGSGEDIPLIYGRGKGPVTSPVEAPRPFAVTTGLGPAPPLVVVPNAAGVVVTAGGVVNVATASSEMSVSLSTGGGDKHHIATDKNKIAGERWTEKFQEIFDDAGVSLQDPRNKVVVAGHKGPHPKEYHELVFNRLTEATDGLTGTAARDALLKELDILGNEIATPGTKLHGLVTK
jgi:hypothetical protein